MTDLVRTYVLTTTDEKRAIRMVAADLNVSESTLLKTYSLLEIVTMYNQKWAT